MHGWLLLLWVQSLWQAALLASGAKTGTVVTKGNVSAEEGGSVILQCHFSTMAEVTQVEWKQRDQLLANFNSVLGWYIPPIFTERVTPGPNMSLTLGSLAMNDTGEYSCSCHTFPDGIYKRRLFLEVRERSVAPSYVPLVSIVAVLGVLCSAVAGMVVLGKKKKCPRIRSAESSHGRMVPEQEEWGLSIPSSPGSPVQMETAPPGLCGKCKEDDCAEAHDYFNVLSYRSLESFIFPVETGY